MDVNPHRGENFYRLKVVYEDGTYFYSAIRRVNFDVDFSEVIVYPNPTTQILNVSMKDFAGMTGNVQIYNSLGHRVWERNYQSLPSQPLQIDVSSFHGGIYFLTIKVDNHRRITRKVIVSRL